MEDRTQELFDIFSKWLKDRWSNIGGAKVAISGKDVIFAARSKMVGFDWDFADTLAELDGVILCDKRFDGMQIETICLVIFEHYVMAHLEPPILAYEFDGDKWSEIKWP